MDNSAEAAPAMPGAPPAGPFTPQEEWAWSRIRAGDTADMSECPEGADADGKAVLSERFLRTILFEEPWASAIARPSVRILNARVRERVNWNYRRVSGELWLDNSVFEQSVAIRGLKVEGLLSLEGSVFHAELMAIGLETGDDFHAIGGMQCEGDLSLINAKIGGDLRLSGATVKGDLRLDNAKVAGGVNLSDADFGVDVCTTGATIAGDLTCQGHFRCAGSLLTGRTTLGGCFRLDAGVVEGEIAFAGSKFGDGLRIAPGFRCAGNAGFDSCHFGAIVLINGASFEGWLNLSASTFAKGLVLGSAMEGAQAVKIAAGFYLFDIDVTGLFSMAVEVMGDTNGVNIRSASDANFDNSTFHGDFSIMSARFNQTVSFEFVTVLGEFKGDALSCEALLLRRAKRLGDVKLIAAQIAGDLQLRQSRIEGVMDLSGVRIGGELHLEMDAERPGPVWGENARLILRNLRCDALAGSIDAFRRADGRFVPTDFSGFACARLGGFGGTQGRSLARAGAGSLIALLRQRVDRSRRYDGQPYEALAGALESSGEAAKARQIRIAARKHELASSGPSLARKIGLFFSGLFIGFGYRSSRALGWFFAATLAAMLFGVWATGQDVLRPQDWRDPLGWLRFALWNGIPLIDPGDGQAGFLNVQVEAAGEAMRLPVTVLQLAFDAAKLFGFVILTYLAAGLSGLASGGGQK